MIVDDGPDAALSAVTSFQEFCPAIRKIGTDRSRIIETIDTDAIIISTDSMPKISIVKLVCGKSSAYLVTMYGRPQYTGREETRR
jgi:hypothetical protein